MARMTKRPDLPDVHRVRAKGRTYFYAYRGGPRLPDPSADVAAFLDAYRTALTERGAAPPPSSATISGVINLYRSSEKFLGLAPSTRREYGRALDRVRADLGDMPTKALAGKRARAVIVRWRDKAFAGKARSADYAIEVLGAMLSWAHERDHVPANPVRGISAIHKTDRSEVIWEPHELAALLAAASPNAAKIIAFAAYTGLREGDLALDPRNASDPRRRAPLAWSEVDLTEGVITRLTNKSGKTQTAIIPLLPEARAVLESLERQSPTVFVTYARKPWTVSGLGNAFRDARKAVAKTMKSVTGKRFHDLRGTAITAFAAAGLEAAEIAAVGGWSPKEVDRIMRRYVSRARVAQAILKRMRSD